jgi:hypothetical protein
MSSFSCQGDTSIHRPNPLVGNEHGDLELKDYIVLQRSKEEFDARQTLSTDRTERHINNDTEFVVVQKRQQRQKIKFFLHGNLKIGHSSIVFNHFKVDPHIIEVTL